jgi:hypothetical protein
MMMQPISSPRQEIFTELCAFLSVCSSLLFTAEWQTSVDCLPRILTRPAIIYLKVAQYSLISTPQMLDCQLTAFWQVLIHLNLIIK